MIEHFDVNVKRPEVSKLVLLELSHFKFRGKPHESLLPLLPVNEELRAGRIEIPPPGAFFLINP